MPSLAMGNILIDHPIILTRVPTFDPDFILLCGNDATPWASAKRE